MKDVFYAIVSFILLTILIGSIDMANDKQIGLRKQYRGWVVIEKSPRCFVTPYGLTLRYGEITEFVVVYESVYMKYELNDTIR